MKSRLGLLIILCICHCGCSCISQYATKTEETEFFCRKLKDRNYRWTGPTSKENRIPKLHAARALAYLGDAGVEFLLYAVDDPKIDRDSVYDALSEVDLPVEFFENDILYKNNAGRLRDWRRENRIDSKDQRSRHRVQIGLPAL